MNTVSADAIPSAGSSVFGQILSSGPLAQLRFAFPEVATTPGSIFEAFIIGIQILSIVLSIAIVIGIVVVIRRTRLLQTVAETLEDVVTAQLPHDEIAERWSIIAGMISSERPNDWKLAVIEADKLLEFSLRHLPFAGETLADKLKQFDRSELSVIDDVWRAHKLRNLLVHGERHEVSQAEVEQAVRAMQLALQELGALS